MRRALAAACLALACAACERGCLTTWVAERGKAGATGTGSGGMPIHAIDCPDGLARCVDRTVQVSRVATVAVPCKGASEQCACPWVDAVTCAHGCAVEGVEVVLPRELATVQLCLPLAANVFARPPPAADAFPPALCDGAVFRCAGGVVVACADEPTGTGAGARAIATCVFGCADATLAIEDDHATSDGAVAVLCARQSPASREDSPP